MCLHFYLVLFEQVGYSMFLVQYRKVFSDQYNFFERVDLAFALLYVYCVLRRMGGIESYCTCVPNFRLIPHRELFLLMPKVENV